MTFEYTRKHPRAPVRLRVHCAGDGLYFSDLTTNLSLGGIGLETVSNLQPGEQLEVEFVTPNGERVKLLSKVVWVKPSGEPERLAAGLKFERVSDEERNKITHTLEAHKP